MFTSLSSQNKPLDVRLVRLDEALFSQGTSRNLTGHRSEGLKRQRPRRSVGSVSALLFPKCTREERTAEVKGAGLGRLMGIDMMGIDA